MCGGRASSFDCAYDIAETAVDDGVRRISLLCALLDSLPRSKWCDESHPTSGFRLSLE